MIILFVVWCVGGSKAPPVLQLPNESTALENIVGKKIINIHINLIKNS